MVKILPLQTKVPNVEFGQAFTRCVEIAESHEPERLFFSVAFTHAQNEISLVADLMVKTRKHPLTATQTASIAMLQNKAAIFLKHVRALHSEPNQADAADIARVFYYVEKHLAGLRRSSSYRQVRLIDGMVKGVESEADVKSALETLGFLSVLETLKTDLEQFDTVYKLRRKSLAEKEKARTTKVKRRLYFLLRQLFTAIELAALQNPELDYAPLVNELNQEIRRCNLSVTSRKKISVTDSTDNLPDEEVAMDEVI